MVSRKLIAVWAVFDTFLLAAGTVSLVLSIIWRKPDILTNMVLSTADLAAGSILGASLLITFLISIVAIIQGGNGIKGLVLLNYALLIDAFEIVIIGTFVWFFTLQERNNFHDFWLTTSSTNRLYLQDQFQCCGYFSGTDQAEIGGSFCVSQSFISGLPAIDSSICVTPITAYADKILNDVFTTVYGFMAIVLCLLLATLCVIKKRQEAERLRKIDAKRGGKGFV